MHSTSIKYSSDHSLESNDNRFRRNVVIVDDNVDQLIIYKFFLEGFLNDFDYIVFTSTEKAIKFVKNSQKDSIKLIISDFHMNPTNGVDFFNELKSREIDIPFVLFSASFSQTVYKDARSAGIENFVQKDLNVQKTLKKLSRFLLDC